MSTFQLGVILGLLSAVTFTILGLWSRVVQQREGPIRYAIYLVAGPAVFALAAWTVRPPDFTWPLVRGVLIVSGPMLVAPFLFGLLFRYGQISHIAPIMGGKTLLVTAMAVMVGVETAGPRIWIAGVVLFLALFLVSGRRELLRRPWRIVEPMLLLILAVSICYGTSDLITKYQMQTYNLSWWDFLSCSWILRGAILSVFLLVYSLLRRQPILPRRWSTFWITGLAGLAHGLVFVPAIKLTDSAILVNLLTSARGIVAVVAVVVLGRLNLGSYERLTRGMIAVRLAGSLLVIVALYIGLSDRLHKELSSPGDAGDTVAGTVAERSEPPAGESVAPPNAGAEAMATEQQGARRLCR
ncbi:MAG: hypothetical protein GWP05_02910 [Anaerolineaceae bacterium]|nr:hypothetical protein [Anaerolineaceae bacterium]